MLPARLFLQSFLRPAHLFLFVLVLLGAALPGQAATMRMVTSSLDDNTTPGTLRAQITAAQSGDTITFAPNVNSITLDGTELVISQDLTIMGSGGGPGGPMLTISGNNVSRIFHVTGGTVVISQMTITQGAVGSAAGTQNGGGILVDGGSLSLSNCTVSASTSTSANGNVGGGGGLSVGPLASATLSNCIFSGDTATIAQGEAEGGGILNAGMLTVTGSTFSGDTAGVGGGLLNSGTLTMSGSIFSSNTAAISGGGLAGTTRSRATISTCTFGGTNSAGFTGGGVSEQGRATLTGCTLTANTAGGGTMTGQSTISGGGLAVLAGGNVTLGTSTVTSNSVSPNASAGNGVAGGGLSVAGSGTLTVSQSTISGNTATEGGGISALGSPFNAASLTLTASTVTGNTAAGNTNSGNGGGGLFVGTNGSASLTNDTLNNNTATNGNGGGADNLGTLTLISSTISANTVDNGSGGGLTNSGASATLQAAIVAGNQNFFSTGTDINGAFTSDGSNLIGDGTSATGFTALHDQVGTADAPVDPLLGPLQNNGGPTFTQEPGTGSPAINGDYSAANVPTTDQRGVARPIGPRADIGAYEAPSPPSAPTGLQATPGFTRITLTWTGSTGAVSYNIYRGTSASREAATPINTKPILGTRYTDTGLTDGQTYYYIVRAVNTAGRSGRSNEAFATPFDNRIRGSVLAWGDNQSGELGNGTFARSLLAVPVSAPSPASAPLNNVVQVAGGSRFSLALTADGFVYAWGDDTYGKLGDGRYNFGTTVLTSDVPTPVLTAPRSPLSNIVAISAGQDHALALAADGTVYTWGRNQYGQLGNGQTDEATSSIGNPYASQVLAVSGDGALSGVVAIAAGGYHSLAVLNDGTAVAWGYNSSGQLGDGTSGLGTDSDTPVTVSALTDAVSVAAGQYFSLALRTDGTVFAWGYDNDGELGDANSGTNEATPIQVSVRDSEGNSLAVTQLAAGSYHTLALTSDGIVYAWGSDDTDQLGKGGTAQSLSYPTPAGLSGSPISALAVGTGTGFSLAIQSVDHTLLTWGANSFGQLGTGATAASQQPALAQTSFGTALPYIYAATGGSLHSLAIENLPPVAGRAAYTVGVSSTGVGIPRTIPAPGLLAYATDAENDTPLTASLVRPAAHGTVMVLANGSFTYVANTGYQGADTFTYKVNDGLADSAPATVTLNVVPEKLLSIAITPQMVTRPESVTQQFTVTGTYNDGNTSVLSTSVAWTSSVPAVATISATTGLATTAAANAGQTTITATVSGLSAQATLTVVRTLRSLTISPRSKSLPKGTTAQFTAAAVYTDGFTQDITASVSFSSSAPAVAAFNGAQGLLTAAAIGTATVTAQDSASGLSATAAVTVTAAALISITVTPANTTLARGRDLQYTATGNYTDGTSVDLTQTVLWATLNPNVATIDATGIAAGVGVGQTLIAAADSVSGLSGTTSILVNDPTVVPKSHLLYNLTGGAVALWNVDTAGRYFEYLYGPFTGFHASALATGPDGLTHILWNRTDGLVAYWTVSPNGSYTSQFYGPFSHGANIFKAVAVSVGSDNTAHILWNNPDGTVVFWTINPTTGAVATTAYPPDVTSVSGTPTALATGRMESATFCGTTMPTALSPSGLWIQPATTSPCLTAPKPAGRRTRSRWEPMGQFTFCGTM